MGRRVAARGREGCGRTPWGGGKKIGGEHITAGSYYNPAVMLIYHRRFVIRPGGDVFKSITAGSYYKPAVIRKHHCWIVI